MILDRMGRIDKDNTKYFVMCNIWICKDQTSQNPRQHINIFAILVTYPYVVLFQWHVNHEKLCLLSNMNIEKSKMNHEIFQYQGLFELHSISLLS
jgi:hypothetical protein